MTKSELTETPPTAESSLRRIALTAGGLAAAVLFAGAVTRIPSGIVERLLAVGLVALVIAVYGYVMHRAAIRLIEPIRAQLEQHRHHALHDPATGLPNRALFDDRVAQAVGGASRTKGCVGVVIVDLNRFKETNDVIGSQAGDRVLRVVAERMVKRLRRTDTVARLGGDNFGIVLSEVDSADSAVRLVQDMQRILSAPIVIEGVPVVVEATAGIALTGEMAFPPATYVQRAERAHRRAKGDPDKCAVHDPALDDEVRDQLALINELRAGIARGELRLFYQPKPRVASGQVRRVEALVRWEHPTRGLLTPNHFIPLAERTGLMRPLTMWVLDEAMRQSREWFTDGRSIKVAVNLSQQSLLDETIHEEVARVLERHSMPAKALEIEITESALVTDLAAARSALERLAGQGIVLSIDDYGTGHSSLAHVRQLPVDCIKIDRAFVSHMDTDPANAAIVRSTVELARNLGMKIVAEGVEREEEWEMLRELGCDFAQGFLVSKPLPAARFIEWMDTNGDRYTGSRGPLPEFVV